MHQPKLLLIDSLLDHLQPLDRTVLADVIRDFTRDTAVIAFGADADALALVCDRVIELTGSILVGVPRIPVLADDDGAMRTATIWSPSPTAAARATAVLGGTPRRARRGSRGAAFP